MLGKYHEIVVFLKYHEKLYFLKYFYTGLSVRTTVCMIWFFFLQKYKWKFNLSTVHGTVILDAQRALEVHGGKNTMKSCVFLQKMYLQCAWIFVSQLGLIHPRACIGRAMSIYAQCIIIISEYYYIHTICCLWSKVHSKVHYSKIEGNFLIFEFVCFLKKGKQLANWLGPNLCFLS